MDRVLASDPRQAIEPAIDHTKQDHGMQRCWIDDGDGDVLDAVLCTTGFNFRWFMRAIARLGLAELFLRLCQRSPMHSV